MRETTILLASNIYDLFFSFSYSNSYRCCTHTYWGESSGYQYILFTNCFSYISFFCCKERMKISKVETPFLGKLYDPALELVCDFYKSIFSFLFPYFARPWKLVPPCFSIWSKVSSLWEMKFRYEISLLHWEYFFSWSFHIEKNTLKIHRKKSFCTKPSSYFYQSYYLAYPPSFYYPSTPIFCWPYFCWTFS